MGNDRLRKFQLEQLKGEILKGIAMNGIFEMNESSEEHSYLSLRMFLLENGLIQERRIVITKA
jgi:hypothetical protein